jgi:hypothetical protein
MLIRILSHLLISSAMSVPCYLRSRIYNFSVLRGTVLPHGTRAYPYSISPFSICLPILHVVTFVHATISFGL